MGANRALADKDKGKRGKREDYEKPPECYTQPPKELQGAKKGSRVGSRPDLFGRSASFGLQDERELPPPRAQQGSPYGLSPEELQEQPYHQQHVQPQQQQQSPTRMQQQQYQRQQSQQQPGGNYYLTPMVNENYVSTSPDGPPPPVPQRLALHPPDRGEYDYSKLSATTLAPPAGYAAEKSSLGSPGAPGQHSSPVHGGNAPSRSGGYANPQTAIGVVTDRVNPSYAAHEGGAGANTDAPHAADTHHYEYDVVTRSNPAYAQHDAPTHGYVSMASAPPPVTSSSVPMTSSAHGYGAPPPPPVGSSQAQVYPAQGSPGLEQSMARMSMSQPAAVPRSTTQPVSRAPATTTVYAPVAPMSFAPGIRRTAPKTQAVCAFQAQRNSPGVVIVSSPRPSLPSGAPPAQQQHTPIARAATLPVNASLHQPYGGSASTLPANAHMGGGIAQYGTGGAGGSHGYAAQPLPAPQRHMSVATGEQYYRPQQHQPHPQYQQQQQQFPPQHQQYQQQQQQFPPQHQQYQQHQQFPPQQQQYQQQQFRPPQQGHYQRPPLQQQSQYGVRQSASVGVGGPGARVYQDPVRVVDEHGRVSVSQPMMPAMARPSEVYQQMPQRRATLQVPPRPVEPSRSEDYDEDIPHIPETYDSSDRYAGGAQYDASDHHFNHY